MLAYGLYKKAKSHNQEKKLKTASTLATNELPAPLSERRKSRDCQCQCQCQLPHELDGNEVQEARKIAELDGRPVKDSKPVTELDGTPIDDTRPVKL